MFLTANEAGSAFAEGPIPAGTSRAGRVYFYNMQRIFPRPTTITVTYQDGTYGPFSREVPVTVSYVATEAEYTPPVIYSNETRSKLVFMVEARPAVADGPKLRPGQPVSVTLK